MLVAAGASLTIKDNQGNSPRSLAQKADDQEFAAYLESKCQLRGVSEQGDASASASPVACDTMNSSESVTPNVSSAPVGSPVIMSPLPSAPVPTPCHSSDSFSPSFNEVPTSIPCSTGAVSCCTFPAEDSGTPQRQGYVSLGTQTCITLTAHSAACAQVLSKALAEALAEEEDRYSRRSQLQRVTKRLRVERLI